MLAFFLDVSVNFFCEDFVSQKQSRYQVQIGMNSKRANKNTTNCIPEAFASVLLGAELLTAVFFHFIFF